MKENLGLDVIQQTEVYQQVKSKQPVANNNNNSNNSYPLPPQRDDSEVLNKIRGIEEKMNSLQNKIESPGLSSAKVFALKKELALLRANKIKLERSISKI